MNQTVDKAIVLRRQDFGEADRVVTFLTHEHGKITGIVKGARRSKSKMAGGIELFSINSITFLAGHSEMKTIVSTRLEQHYDNIVKNIDRTMWAYEALKLLDRATEEATEPTFFEITKTLLESLNDGSTPLEVIRLWFGVSMLHELGHTVNANTDGEGRGLNPADQFNFSFETMSFHPEPQGQFSADHIKCTRLAGTNNPKALSRVRGADKLVSQLIPTLDQAVRLWVH